MIPSLASAGYLEPLDEYMKKADFKIEAVSDYANFMTYKGQTYGIPTDGNVHIQYVRKGPNRGSDNKKRYADKHGKELTFPATWRMSSASRRLHADPAKDLYGSGSLRNRANGPTWWFAQSRRRSPRSSLSKTARVRRSSLSRALAWLGQEQHSDRERPREHV